MVIDKLKLTTAIKIFALITYFLYFSINFFNLNSISKYPEVLKSDLDLKSKFLSKSCLVILGGSNAKTGLSAEILSTNLCNSINLGVDYEAQGFDKYSKWLDHGNMAEKVLYSTMEVWKSSNKSGNLSDEYFNSIFPRISLFSIIKASFFSDNKSYNDFGDKINYQCFNVVGSNKTQVQDFSNSNILVAQEISRRISILKTIYKTDKIFLRIPPIYLDSNNSKIYKKLMAERIEVLKEMGINVIDSTLVSIDESLFCESNHPNAKGREVFSKEIRLP